MDIYYFTVSYRDNPHDEWKIQRYVELQPAESFYHRNIASGCDDVVLTFIGNQSNRVLTRHSKVVDERLEKGVVVLGNI